MNIYRHAARGRRLESSLALALGLLLIPCFDRAAELPIVTGVETQPLAAQVRRVTEALDLNGAPLTADEKSALASAATLTDADTASPKSSPSSTRTASSP